MFSEEFMREIKSLALQIAKRQRGEDHMQDIEVLQHKFDAEKQELSEASEQWDELPDVTYYAACMMIVWRDLATFNSSPYAPRYGEEGYDESEELRFFYAEERAKEHTKQALSDLEAEIQKRGASVAQIEAGTLAKYRLRASQPKDIEQERAVILAAIRNV